MHNALIFVFITYNVQGKTDCAEHMCGIKSQIIAPFLEYISTLPCTITVFSVCVSPYTAHVHNIWANSFTGHYMYVIHEDVYSRVWLMFV